jgi:hypothetical protein
MEKATKIATEEILAKAKEELIEAPSRLREKLHHLGLWAQGLLRGESSRSSVSGSDLTSLYGAKFQTIARED